MMLKKITIGLAFLTIGSTAISQTFGWVKGFGGTGVDFVRDITTDADGNVYTTGGFQGTVDFDPGAGTASLTASGSYNTFITKMDQNGTLIWAKHFSGLGYGSGMSIKVDNFGNVVVAGNFYDYCDFNPNSQNFELNAGSSSDGFICKLNSSGNFVWAAKFGSSAFDIVNSIDLDAAGNVYATGEFNGTVDFDSGNGTSNLTAFGSNNKSDAFVLKLNAAGTLSWVKQIGGINADKGMTISVDNAGNVYSVGKYVQTIDVNPGTETVNLGAPFDGAYISKLDNSGAFVWGQNIGEGGYVSAIGLDIDLSGNVYMTGMFRGTIDFDLSSNLSELTVNSANLTDIYVSKLDDSGAFVWVKQFKGEGDDGDLTDEVRGLTVDAFGNVYLTGFNIVATDFDPGAGEFILQASSGSWDIFITKLNTSGGFEWAQQFGNTSGNDMGRAVAVHPSGNVYFAGIYFGTIDFNSGVAEDNLVSNGNADSYIINFDECPSNYGIVTQSACSSFTWINGVTYTSNTNTATYVIPGGSVNSCDSLVLLNLTINSIPNLSATLSGTTLTASVGNATYLWLDCNDGFAPLEGTGATNQSFTPTVSGNYAVQVTLNGCSDTSNCTQVTIQGVGINENEIYSFNLQPNPAKELVTISNLEAGSLITLIDLSGKTIAQINASSTSQSISTNDFNSGVYFVSVVNSTGKIGVQRLIIE